MTTPVWESGKLYLPGDLVQPITAVAAASAAITNAGFESGDTGWTKGTGWTIGQEPSFDAFGGTWSAQFVTGTNSYLQSTFVADVDPGTSITASCMVQQGASSAGTVGAAVVLEWLDAASALVSRSEGNFVSSGSGGSWNQSTVTAVCPAGAEKVRIAARGNRTSQTAPLWVDNFTWSLVSQALPAGLIYKAVQAAAGFSGSTEPAWPSTLGVTVVDNEVTWEAVSTSRVTWEASPILRSGTVEPTWPTIPGAFISDGTISWECISRRVEDEKCPNTKVVAIMASKVFAADGDIVRFSATANPLDWSSANDAGYLPTGLQQANANDMAVLAPYRSNLAAFNASSFQNWQVDPDPAAMAQVDQMEGVGSTWTRAAQPVGNELFYLAARGVRTVGIAAGAANLAAGDVGMPIDPLVQEAARVALANGSKALATYYPSAGQYWLTFADYPPPAPGITGDLPDGSVGDAGTLQYVVTGGVLPYGPITVTAGALPPGATMDAAGLVTYDYTTAGSYSWTVGGVDADGTPFSIADAAEVEANVSAIYFSVGNKTTIFRSDDDWATAPDEISTGLATITSTASVHEAGGRLFHFGANNEGRVSLDGSSFAACSGLPSGPGGDRLIYVNGEWQLYLFSDPWVSTDGSAFAVRTITGHALFPAVSGTSILGFGGSNNLQISTNSGATFSQYALAGLATVPAGVQATLARQSGGFVIFGLNGSGNLTIGTSATGASGSWTLVAGPATTQCAAVARSTVTGRVLMVLTNGTSWYSDDDCNTWSAGPTLTVSNVYCLAFVGGYFYMGSSPGGGVNRIHRTANADTAWAQVYERTDSNAITAICELTP